MNDILLNPTAANVRHQDYDNIYHIYNRIAHSVRFLEEVEKDDLQDRFFRIADFAGIKLLSWCLMTNHFHLLVYLPEPRNLAREEIERRLNLLRPEERAVFVDGFILDRAPQEITRRMFHIGMMMKIVKENFTVAYNERTGHHGTMWEGPYRFKKIPMRVRDMMTVAAYQNLNPIRACMASDYTSYPWTSFAAASRGDRRALSGIEFMLGGYEQRTNLSDTLVHSSDFILARMQGKMDRDLETYQLERAEHVWRKRLAGEQVKQDPLTSEAMIELVEKMMARLQTEDFHAELARRIGRELKCDEIKVVQAMAGDPEAKVIDLAKLVCASESRVKRICLMMQKVGVIRREGTKRRSVWKLVLCDSDAA